MVKSYFAGRLIIIDAFIYLPLLIILLISAITDLRKRLIYDWLTLPGIIYFFAYHSFAHNRSLLFSLAGFFILGGLAFSVAVISSGKLGGGDIKLFALLGTAVGWQAGLLILFITYLIAGLTVLPFLVVKKIKQDVAIPSELPLAPFMALGNIFIILAARSLGK